MLLTKFYSLWSLICLNYKKKSTDPLPNLHNYVLQHYSLEIWTYVVTTVNILNYKQVLCGKKFPTQCSNCRFAKTATISYKSSAVAEMGDHGHNKNGPKKGAAVPLSWRGSWVPAWTEVYFRTKSSSIQPFGHHRHGLKNGCWTPFRGGSCDPI